MPRITIDNLSEYLLNGESDTIELKRSIPPQLDIIIRLISAFANTKGGSIIFGYDEQKKELVGVAEDQVRKLKSKIEKVRYKSNCLIYTLQVEGKLVAVVDVEKAKADIYANSVAYIRRGADVFPKVGDIRSNYLKEFIKEIQFRNRNPKNVKVLELLNDLSTNPERRIITGAHLYRGRIIHDIKKIGKEPGFWGYGKEDSFVPPPEVTRDLRANYRYIPYLYCANHPYTALIEVRPRLGADVSLATINVNEDLTLLDFTLKEIPKKISDAKLNLFADLSMLFSKPVASDDDVLDYIPTQYVAEFAKNLGYDGIVFRSSLTPELEGQDMDEHQELDRYNIVVFNYQKCTPIGSNIINVTRNYLEFEQTDCDSNRLEIHTSILDIYF